MECKKPKDNGEECGNQNDDEKSAKPMNVLVGHNDPAYAERLAAALIDEGLLVTSASTGADIRKAIREQEFDVIIMSFMFRDVNAMQLCRSIRKAGVGTPIIVLSVPDHTEERVAVLDAGADDFIDKPVEFRELIAHMNAMVRRCQADNAHILDYADLELDTANRNVSRGKRAVVLTPREFALLEYLVRNRDRVVDRGVVGEHVWGEDYANRDSNVVDVYVSRLRRKIDTASETPLIHTAPGIGYMLSSRRPVKN